MSSFSTRGSKSWGERLMSSVVGALIGLLLFVIAFPVLFYGEWHVFATESVLGAGAKAVVSVPSADKVDPANEGKLVHLQGTAEPGGKVADKELGMPEQTAVRVNRVTEIYQWKEETHEETKKKLGGGEETITTYTHSKVWSPTYESSDGFHVGPDEPEMNNVPKAIDDKPFTARPVKLGAFELSDKLVDDIKTEEPLPVDEKTWSKPVEGPGWDRPLKVVNGQYYYGTDPANPKVGDERIKFTIVKPQKVSVLANQSGSSLTGWGIPNNPLKIEQLTVGEKNAEQMFADLNAEAAGNAWGFRLVGFLIMAVGIFLMLRPVATFADVIPVFGNFVSFGLAIFAAVIALPLSLGTIAVGWLYYRPLIGIPMLVVAVAGFAGLAYLGFRIFGKKAEPART
jgi:hypothetical protein